MKRCMWCHADGDQKLMIGCSDGKIVTVRFCKKHMDQFVSEQNAKGRIAMQPVRIDPTGEAS